MKAAGEMKTRGLKRLLISSSLPTATLTIPLSLSNATSVFRCVDDPNHEEDVDGHLSASGEAGHDDRDHRRLGGR